MVLKLEQRQLEWSLYLFIPLGIIEVDPAMNLWFTQHGSIILGLRRTLVLYVQAMLFADDSGATKWDMVLLPDRASYL
jgi:hypothetical protein